MAEFQARTRFGLPARLPVVQFPNAPSITAFAASEMARHSHGSGHGYTASVSRLAMTVWARDELAGGVNWFRRLLGVT